jgi:hypothetical protein
MTTVSLLTVIEEEINIENVIVRPTNRPRKGVIIKLSQKGIGHFW